MSGSPTYDLAIVGSGSAAFAAAIEARRRDASVVMIESGVVGGTCVNVGCVPSKALLSAAAARHLASTQNFAGVATSAGPVDMAALVAGKDAIVDALRDERYVGLARRHGFEVLAGHARFVAGPALEVGARRVEAAHYVIATGAVPWTPPIDGLDEAGYLTSTTAMDLDHVPGSLVVIGAGSTGLELGQLFARLGARVTIVESLGSIAAGEEPELSAALAVVLGDEGLCVRTGTTVSRVDRRGDGVALTLDGPAGREEIVADAVVLAAGRRPRRDDLGLAVVGVETGPRGAVLVDEELRTTNPRIYAAGDVTGHPQFVYVAGRHGTVVAANALGEHRRVDYRSLPRVTFTSPALASVGLTDAQAEAAGIACTCRVLSLSHVPRAVVDLDTRGVVKIVADAGSGEVLGVHLLAEGAGDAILAAVYALDARLTVTQLAEAWTPYLTIGEAIKLAAQSFTRDVDSLSCCAS